MSNNSIRLWSPDTCSCVIHQAYDDTIAPADTVFTFVTEEQAEELVSARRRAGDKHINRNKQPPAKLCPAHASLGHTVNRFNIVLAENRLKNGVLAAAQEVNPDVKPSDYRWSFDADRNLEADFAGMSLSDKSKVRDKLPSTDKVKVKMLGV